MLENLCTPKVRGGVSMITGSYWKEVDRNLKILESVDIVRGEPPRNSISVYGLTKRGEEILQFVNSNIR